MHRNPYSFFTELTRLPIYAFGRVGKRLTYRLRYARQIKTAREDLGIVGSPKFAVIDEKFCRNLNRLLFHYMNTYTLPYLLRGEDRNCMAHSIEARIPFIDYRLVDTFYDRTGEPAFFLVEITALHE